MASGGPGPSKGLAGDREQEGPQTAGQRWPLTGPLFLCLPSGLLLSWRYRGLQMHWGLWPSPFLPWWLYCGSIHRLSGTLAWLSHPLADDLGKVI
jgi:hypothetical protein